MNTSRIFPIAALVLGLAGAGAMIATAQDLTPEADTAGTTDAQVMQANSRDSGGKGHGPRHGEGHRGGFGFGGGPGRGEIFANLITRIDTDGNGAITQAEIDAFRAAQLAAADVSKDGALSVDEFETIYQEFVRPRMVDAFQDLDADGDGAVTTTELDARFGSIVERMDQNDDGALDEDDARRGNRG